MHKCLFDQDHDVTGEVQRTDSQLLVVHEYSLKPAGGYYESDFLGQKRKRICNMKLY